MGRIQQLFNQFFRFLHANQKHQKCLNYEAAGKYKYIENNRFFTNKSKIKFKKLYSQAIE